MSNFEQIAHRERHERSIGYVAAIGLFAVIALILAAWILYL